MRRYTVPAISDIWCFSFLWGVWDFCGVLGWPVWSCFCVACGGLEAFCELRGSFPIMQGSFCNLRGRCSAYYPHVNGFQGYISALYSTHAASQIAKRPLQAAKSASQIAYCMSATRIEVTAWQFSLSGRCSSERFLPLHTGRVWGDLEYICRVAVFSR